MPFIQNVSASRVMSGMHLNPGEDAILIQVMDPGTKNWPHPLYEFDRVHRFEFLDAEDDLEVDEVLKFSDEQAAGILNVLKDALDSDVNVIVQCHAGVCRSGAIAEVGTMLGFDDTYSFRQPNMRVMDKLIKEAFGDETTMRESATSG